MNWKDYIVTEPEGLIGKPTPKGKRLSIERILDRPLLEAGVRTFASASTTVRAIVGARTSALGCGFDGFRKRALITVA
jgi:hypothetical protein